MRIYCPKCNIGYEVNENLIGDKVRKLRCSNCGEIFEFDKNGVSTVKANEDEVSSVDDEAETTQVQNDDEEAINRESLQTEQDIDKENLNSEELSTDNIDEKTENLEETKKTVNESSEAVEDENIKAANREIGNENNEKIIAEGVDSETSEETENSEAKPENTADKEAKKIDKKPVPEHAVDIKDVLARLSEQNEKLFQEEKELPTQKRVALSLKTMLGLHRKFNFKIIISVLMLIAVILLYENRYDIVRKVPFMHFVYNIFGVESKIPGEGLEFQNINWEYSQEGNRRLIIIKGFVANPSKKAIDIPLIHIEVLDKNAQLLQSLNQRTKVKVLAAEGRANINIILKAVSPTTKYVYLTFIKG